MPVSMKTSTASFRLPPPEKPGPSQWPAFACIAGVLAASLIALNPTIADSWSQVSYPVIARIDEKLMNYGIAIGPTPESSPVPSKPVIAVVFGCISADESEEEAEEFPPKDIEPELPSTSIIRPANFTSKRPRETSEADELLQ